MEKIPRGTGKIPEHLQEKYLIGNALELLRNSSVKVTYITEMYVFVYLQIQFVFEYCHTGARGSSLEESVMGGGSRLRYLNFNDPSKTIGICASVTRWYLCVCIYICIFLLTSLVLLTELNFSRNLNLPGNQPMFKCFEQEMARNAMNIEQRREYYEGEKCRHQRPKKILAFSLFLLQVSVQSRNLCPCGWNFYLVNVQFQLNAVQDKYYKYNKKNIINLILIYIINTI